MQKVEGARFGEGLSRSWAMNGLSCHGTDPLRGTAKVARNEKKVMFAQSRNVKELELAFASIA